MQAADPRFLERYGPCALVTGASDGIGRAFAQHLGALGFDLVLAARRAEPLEAMAREARRAKRSCVALAADLGTPAGMAALTHAIEAHPIGLAVCAAGFGSSGEALSHPVGEELAMVDVNCRAVLATALAVAPAMRARGRGGLVLMSSLLAFQGVPRAANYAATKAYVQTLGEGLAAELRPHGVDVLNVAPGPVRSGFAARANMRMGMTDEPSRVAQEALDRLARGGTVRPGRLGFWLEASLAPLPRRARSAILARVMGAMTAHQ